MRINPVYRKELKVMARSRQLPVLAVLFNSVLSVAALLILYCINQRALQYGAAPYKYMMLYYMVLLSVEIFLLCLFVPSVAGGSIAGERERQTLDILLASKMTVREIITGKLMSCISMALLLAVSSLPVLAISALYGGIGLGDIYQSAVYMAFLLMFIGCVGVFCSCRFEKNTYASVAAYGIFVFLTIGTLAVVLLVNLAFQVSAGGGDASVPIQDTFPIGWLVYLLLFNPAVTYAVVLSEQLGDMQAIAEILDLWGASEWALDHWILLSILAQMILMITLIMLSVWYLDPQNERFQAGRLLKKHKSH